jgi:hypothetical protein
LCEYLEKIVNAISERADPSAIQGDCKSDPSQRPRCTKRLTCSCHHDFFSLLSFIGGLAAITPHECVEKHSSILAPVLHDPRKPMRNTPVA